MKIKQTDEHNKTEKQSKSEKAVQGVSTEYTNVTDGETPRDGIGRAYT